LLVTLLATTRSDHTAVLLAATSAVMAAIAVLAATSLAALAVVAVVSAAAGNPPQMLRALADPRRLAGVSAATYWLIAAASTCWLLSGVGGGRPGHLGSASGAVKRRYHGDAGHRD
jgi:hypothetical protein